MPLLIFLAQAPANDLSNSRFFSAIMFSISFFSSASPITDAKLPDIYNIQQNGQSGLMNSALLVPFGSEKFGAPINPFGLNSPPLAAKDLTGFRFDTSRQAARFFISIGNIA